MPAWQILPVTLDDVPDISRNNVTAMWDDDFWRLSIKADGLEHRIAQTNKRQYRNLVDGHAVKRFQKAVHPDTGKLVGFIRWEFPDEASAATADGQLLLPDGLGPSATDEQRKQFDDLAKEVKWESYPELDVIDDEVHAAKERLLGDQKFVKLDYLAVLPEYQRQGVATALVGAGIKEVSKSGLPILLYACKAGQSLYRRYGFKELHRAYKDMAEFGGQGEHGLSLMVRDVDAEGQ